MFCIICGHLLSDCEMTETCIEANRDTFPDLDDDDGEWIHDLDMEDQ